jgi:integrase
MKTASGLTIAIRKGDQNVHSLAQEDSHENESIALPAERIIADRPWTATQQRLLEVLERKEYRFASITQICQAAGYSGNRAWYQAMKDSRFATVVQALGVLSWSRPKRRLLEVLQHPENRSKSGLQICRLAGYKDHVAWNRAIKDERFVAELQALGVTLRRRSVRASHLEVTSVTNIEEELKKDIWDVRRLKHNYPKHVAPSIYVIDFTWIGNPLLREQVKRYYRHQLPRWNGSTFQGFMYKLMPVLTELPPEVHMGTITRSHIEVLLPAMGLLSENQANRSLQAMRTMTNYMATSPSWTGPRPPRFLIWKEDIPKRPQTLPRPIPPYVLDQFDPLLEKAEKAMKEHQEPSLLAPIYWDALLILRHTGMRFEDLAHLKAPDEHGRNGCLDQDSDGYWWIRIEHTNTKMGKDHRIPTRTSDGVIDAIRRQYERSKRVPNHFGAYYLFRTEQGLLPYLTFAMALKRLAPHLQYEGHPYVIAPHQFRHTIATDMIEQGVDIYTVKEFLGHTSLAMTERYVKVYLSSLKAKYDAYRVKKQQTYATEMMAAQIQITQPEGDADGGWVENKVGKLYVSPLPDGIGNCVHLPMHDGCPDSPHCPTCPKLRANKRHLPVWESKATNLLITVEALRANPAYARARQKHEQELAHAEKVIKTIKEEGFWDGRIHNNKTNEN